MAFWKEDGLLVGHVEELNWIIYFRSKMRVVDDETELYFVFSLSHFSPAFGFLAFGYVLSSGAFLVEAFLRPIPKFRTCGLAGVCTLMLRWA